MKTLTLITLLATCAPALCQVHLDRPMVLTGEASEDRQVLGLPAATAPWHLLDAGTEQAGSHRYAQVPEALVWAAAVPGLEGPPMAGTHLMVLPEGHPGGEVSITINAHGPYPITWGGHTPFSALDVPAGTVLSLVFDGSGFQVLNGQTHQRRECPDDMVAVNDQFCVDLIEHDLEDWYAASMTCMLENKRLCSWGEFYVACTYRFEIGVPDMQGNHEWTNSSANFYPAVRVCGTACATASTVQPLSPPRAFHCCVSR